MARTCVQLQAVIYQEWIPGGPKKLWSKINATDSLASGRTLRKQFTK